MIEYIRGGIAELSPATAVIDCNGLGYEIAPTLRAAIKAIYKSGTYCPVSTQHCDLATPKSWATFYNLEVVIALAFRLNTYEASRIRQKVLEGLCQRKENGISIVLSLGNIGHQISSKGLC